MADLGAIGKHAYVFDDLRQFPQFPLSGISNPYGEPGSYLDRTPIWAEVLTPSPGAAFHSLETYTPGRFYFEKPVDAGSTVTVTVQCRINADYVASGILGLGGAPVSLLPYLEVELPGGAKTRATKDADADVFDTLTVGPLTVALAGTAVIRLVAQGNFGDNLLFVPEAQRPNVSGPKVWWADLQAITA